VTREAAMREKLKKRLRFYGIFAFSIWVSITFSTMLFLVVGR
jgi:hypothetical protein